MSSEQTKNRPLTVEEEAEIDKLIADFSSSSASRGSSVSRGSSASRRMSNNNGDEIEMLSVPETPMNGGSNSENDLPIAESESDADASDADADANANEPLLTEPSPMATPQECISPAEPIVSHEPARSSFDNVVDDFTQAYKRLSSMYDETKPALYEGYMYMETSSPESSDDDAEEGGEAGEVEEVDAADATDATDATGTVNMEDIPEVVAEEVEIPVLEGAVPIETCDDGSADDADVDAESTEPVPTKPETLISKFYELADTNRTKMKRALIAYDDDIEVSEVYTWKEYAERVTRFKNYLLQYSLSNVAIHAFNSPEWFVATMGSIAARKHVAGIYNTNTDLQCLHVIETGDCRVLVLDTVDTLIKHYSQVFQQLYDAKVRILIIDYVPISNSDLIQKIDDEKILGQLENLYDRCVRSFNREIDQTSSIRELYPVEAEQSDTVTLIFTSGTTSNPKAVKITHSNIMSSIDDVLKRLPMGDDDENPEVVLSYLPLSHVAGQCLDIYAQIYHAGEVHFARPDALRGSLRKSLTTVRPTVFLGVPRVWEKMKEGLLDAAAKKYEGVSGGILKAFAQSAKAVNYNYQKNVDDSKESYYSYFASCVNYPSYCISSSLTNPVLAQLGFDRCKYYVSGAAPISTEVLQYFMSLNVPIHEIYGMSETAGLITISDPFSSINGFCGIAGESVEIKVDDETEEILVRGPNVFGGYHNYDGDMTGMFDEDGFFRTGDCGKIENQRLKITGRLKELIITAGGENIPPVLIEEHIKREVSTDSLMMVVGDQKKYLTILIFNGPDEPQLTEDGVMAGVKAYNENHAISNSQKVQKFSIIRETLTPESGLLTPTMKMKRPVIATHYQKVIDALYGE